MDNKVQVWYHSGFARITVSHLNFSKATLCKIMVVHLDLVEPTVIPNMQKIC